MKNLRIVAASIVLTALLLSPAARATDAYAGASYGSSTNTTWNQTDANAKWTSSGGTSYGAAVAGMVYHTNGYNVKAGRIGQAADQGAAPSTTFVGAQLIIDGYTPSSTATSTTGAGLLQFELTNTSVTPAVGPRASATAYTQASYAANIVTASTTTEVRTIRGATGVITLNGTLMLNGKTNFNLPSAINDMRFNIEAPVSGAGDIDLSGGSAGGTTLNGYITWAFRDLTHWTGSKITVMHKHTISFTGNADFYTTNPSAALSFSSTSIGFLNLSADVSFASGKVTFTTGTTAAPVTTTVPDGAYTVSQLNGIAAAVSGTNTYVSQPWASEGAAFNTAGTTYKLYVGQGIPAVAPVIVTQPIAKAVAVGETVAFTVEVTGSPTPTFQWKKDNTDVPGATGSSLTLANVTTAEAGDYTVVVTNTGGSVTSAIATLTVQASTVLPTITTQPASRTNYVGTTAIFSVVATGTPAPSYQWQKDGADVAGATGSTLSLAKVQLSAAGSYTVIVTNTAGSVTSDAAVLSVTDQPTGIDSYANANAASGDTWNGASVGVKWTPDGGANYFEAIAGNTYHTNGYTVKAGRQGVNADVGAAGWMGFLGEKLLIDGFDAASGLTSGTTTGGLVYFDLAATSNGPRLLPASQTQATYYVNLVTQGTTGSDVRTIRGGTGVTTLIGTLELDGYTVFSVPSGVNDMCFQVNSQVSGQGSIELSGGTSASGTANGFVTWAFKDLSLWRGAKISVLNKHTISFTRPADFYRTNAAMELAFSSTSIGFLNLQADISLGSGKLSFMTGTTSSPVKHIVPDGIYTVASLNDYVANSSATNNSYSTQPLASEGASNTATPNTAGTTYHVYIGSGLPIGYGSPTITSQPEGQSVVVGDTVSLAITAAGDPTLIYQWKKDGADIAGADGPTLTLTNVALTDAGDYTVVVTNSSGSVTSHSATLVVQSTSSAPVITTQPLSRTVYAGTMTTFTVVATGIPSPTYLWLLDGQPLTTTSTGTLTLGNLQSNAAGSYTVKITNAAGSVTSDAAVLTITPLPTGIDAYANADAIFLDTWNTPMAGTKWTFDGGANYLAASAGNTYHTNGYSVRADRVGVNANVGPAGMSTFAGQTLVIDGFDAASNLTGNGAGDGQIYFELAFTASGPRLAPATQTRGSYTVNLVTAPVTAGHYRTITGDTGAVTLNGTLTLNGDTNFTIPTGVSDMYFQVAAPISGTGNIYLSGGSSGSATANGFVTWAFSDLSQWKGGRISVLNKHTISFLNPTDFCRTNPAMELAFPSTTAGFLNLQADISLGSGKLTFVTDTTSNVHVVPDGIYTVADLNAYVASFTGSNAYSAQPLASEGPTNVVTPNIAGTTYRIFVGRSFAAAITTQPQSQSVAVGADVTFTVAASGSPAPAYQWQKDGIDISGATGPTLTLTSVPVSAAGSYIVVATNSGGSVTSDTAVLTVNQLTPAITWSAPAAINYGTPLSATQLNATANVPGTFTYTPALGEKLNAGNDQTLSMTFTPADSVNYASVTASTKLTVNKVTPVITWTMPAPISYSMALTAAQLNATADIPGDFVYAPVAGTVLDVGAGRVLSVTFTPTDSQNYSSTTATTMITVNRFVPTATWTTPAAITYGTRLSATQLNATADAAGSFAYDPALGTTLNAGTQTLNAVFFPNDITRYNNTTVTTTITVQQATPAITWAAPAEVPYGTALSATQLNATANVPGTFTYTPALGTVLNTGAGQTLGVTFTPTDTVNYAPATASTTITINQATPVITWAIPAAITYGTLLSDEQLNATANVAGTFAYSPAKDAKLNAGGQTLQVTFTPTDPNYEPANGSTTLTVEKAPLTAKASDASRTFGAANPTFAITYTGFVNGDTAAAITAPTASTTATETSAPGTYPITLTGGSATNYTFTLQAGTLTVIPASYAGSYFGTFPSGGYWALSLKSDNTGKYIAYLPARHSAVVVDLTVGADGTFTVTGTEIVPATANPVSALALGNPEAPLQRTAAAASNYTLSGTIAYNGAVSGQLTGLNETFTGAADAATGPAQASAGLYTASALGTTSSTTYAIIGASGQAVIVTTGAAVDGASGTVDASGQLSTPTSGGAALVLTIDANAHSVAASVTPAGGGQPVVYNGVASTVTAEARVVNLSVRSQAGTGSQTLIVGLVINGGGNKTLLLRGAGPALVPYGVVNALADPAMRLLDKDGTQLDSNDNWDNSLATVMTNLGASAYAPNSKDAALYKQLSGGVYSMHVYPAATGTGVVLAELYDADATATGAEVVNISARTQVGVDENILILGFVIRGNTPKTLLIRGVGPTLIPLGVPDGLLDPQLFLYQGNTVLTTNDNWGGTTALKNAAASVGAGALVADSSKDAALLVTLAPGVYSAQVSGVGRTTGVGLVEIFLLP